MIPFFRKIRNQPAGEAGKMRDNNLLFSGCHTSLRLSIFLFLVLLISCMDGLSAQNSDLPLHEGLKTSFEKMKVKLGAKIMSSTFKIKMGDYTMARTKINRENTGDNNIFDRSVENSFSSNF